MAEDIIQTIDLPYTISFAIGYRMRISSFNELPNDKRPPRNLWDKPTRLEEFLETIWDTNKSSKKSNFVDINLEEVE